MLESVVKSTSTETLSDLIGSGVLWAGAGGVVCVSGVGAEFAVSAVAGVCGVVPGAVLAVVFAVPVAICAGTATDAALSAEAAAFALSASAMRC